MCAVCMVYAVGNEMMNCYDLWSATNATVRYHFPSDQINLFVVDSRTWAYKRKLLLVFVTDDNWRGSILRYYVAVKSTFDM